MGYFVSPTEEQTLQLDLEGCGWELRSFANEEFGVPSKGSLERTLVSGRTTLQIQLWKHGIPKKLYGTTVAACHFLCET